MEKNSNIPEYHQSSINMFLKCPRQYMFRYLMNIVSPPKAALTLGSAFDTATTKNYIQKINTRADLKSTDVQDLFSTDFDKRSTETEWDGEDPGKQKDLGVKMLTVFHEKASPKIQPIAVQSGFRIETDAGYALGGTMDLIDESQIIRDTKTSKAEYSPDAVSESLQATMYDFAYQTKTGVKPRGFAFDVITKHKEPRYQEVVGVVEKTQTEIMFESINMMHSQINRGEFQYAPEGAWWCSKDWCAYHSKCKGKKS